MSSSSIDVKVIEPAGTVVLNRPEHGNALTRSMVQQLVEALDDLYLEKRVRAIILTGAGSSFCTGADVAEMRSTQDQDDPETQWGEDAADFRDLLVRMMEITKPLIAAVHGPALSGGAALVAACDLVVASHESTFGMPEPSFGMVAGLAAPLVAFRIGAGQAARLLLTGSAIDAQEAMRIGIFHELTAADTVWARAMEVAKLCAAGSPEALQLTKRMVNETLGENLTTQLSTGAIMTATARTTEHAAEGIAALVEGRRPIWK
ncbi:MAG TPA: enoyl-CoA hydratase/isomerase family protein [Lacipirellulaceae bacterium]|nr:enoyl-CoA hydratase/isomerase family protein [Lacipirellulaceae bacterium]